MIRTVAANSREQQALFDDMRARAEKNAAEVRERVAEIISDVRQGGWEAVRALSLRFDNAEPYEISQARCREAMDACDPAVLDAMRRAAKNIEDYQRRLMPCENEWQNSDGGRVGVRIRGLTRVGVYVPGGSAAYPSSLLMNIIPAKVAGVREIIVVTPPTVHLRPEVLAAAHIAGADRVFAVGGPVACAALAFGAGDIPKVDKIVGPGNAYVTEAKRQLFGLIDIDMTAGPSEILILADETAEPAYAAADMLSQAEHSADASAVLLTTSRSLAEAVVTELESQLKTLPRRAAAEASLDSFGAVVLCGTMDEAVALANEIAPEHLEIMTESPRSLLPGIVNAGAVFLGAYTPEPVGDYMAGPCHVLPTSGTARFFSPLSVDDFLKKTSVLEYDAPSLARIAAHTAAFAMAEGLDAHARSVTCRGGAASGCETGENRGGAL